jgi:hypothetical protein
VKNTATRLVPTAIWALIPKYRIRTGIRKTPPPTPIREETIPIAREIRRKVIKGIASTSSYLD